MKKTWANFNILPGFVVILAQKEALFSAWVEAPPSHRILNFFIKEKTVRAGN